MVFKHEFHFNGGTDSGLDDSSVSSADSSLVDDQTVGTPVFGIGAGQVVASDTVDSHQDTDPVTYTYTTIDPSDSTSTVGLGINDSGQVVGFYDDSSGEEHGFLDSGGTYTTIDPPGSTSTDPLSINDSGQVVGIYEDSNGTNHGFLYSSGTYTILDVPGSTSSTAYSINDSGQIVGGYTDSNGQQGFLYSGGTYSTIDDPPGTYTLANGINGSGQIVGYFVNGTDHGFVATPGPVCFMPGTMIRTPDGEIVVEALQIGDTVLTSEGFSVPVRWNGRQTVSTVFADPLRVVPIRIKKGALDDNMPVRDLLVSPDHAVLVGDILVQAGALVNGTSIVRETNVPQTFTYYHIECDGHELILAEGVPAETFVDNVERLAFDNWAEHEALYPEGRTIDELPHPRAKAYRQLPRSIRERLAERAERLHGPRLQNVT
jgi:probable HAF family extracellular repeat protein